MASPRGSPCSAALPTHTGITNAHARRSAISPCCAAARPAWRRGSGRRSRLPVPPTLEPAADCEAASPAVPYTVALAQSIARSQCTAEQLAMQAASQPAGGAAAMPLPLRLQAAELQRLGCPQPTAAAAPGTALFHEDTLMRLGTLSSVDISSSSSFSSSDSDDGGSPAPAPGFNADQRLTVPGLADVALLSWGGRVRGKWKAANQDAFAAAALDASPAHPAALLVVCDGHGRGGERASAAAARGLAGAVPQAYSHLMRPGGSSNDSSSGDGSSSSSSGSGGWPAAQQALIAAFQAVGTSMRGSFDDCGTAALACLLEPRRMTAVWAGDCRAVAGLVLATTQGPAVLVHPLSRDHKPDNPLEHARIAATGRGRVVQLRAGHPHRLCGFEPTSNSIALSRALGDAWAAELGLTYEPDALSITLPDPALASLDWPGTSSSSSMSSVDAEALEEAGSRPRRAARHVLVAASDGLWDMLSNEEAVGIALSCPSPDAAAEALMQTACRRWAAAFEGEFLDDITLAVAFLPA